MLRVYCPAPSDLRSQVCPTTARGLTLGQSLEDDPVDRHSDHFDLGDHGAGADIGDRVKVSLSRSGT